VFNPLVSDRSGRIFDIPGLEAVGMKAGCLFRIDRREYTRMPKGSKLFMLPGRIPAGYNPDTGDFESLENYFAVAVFMPPAFTATYSAAYQLPSRRWSKIHLRGGGRGADALPLFCYTAAGFYKGGIYVAAVRVDRSTRHDPRFINLDLVKDNTIKIKKIFPRNRLIRHLADCALAYDCPGAQNFFLSREECPLPVSPHCNANCAGCISLNTQPRIRFTPTPEEIRDVALFHINRVRDTVLSFGQGCEGEPLLQADLIERSIRLIRKETSQGSININTNASRPESISRLFDIGLSSIRVSMNSCRPEYYKRYYKPTGYDFCDVLSSIKIAKRKKGFVSINYLTMPGFTDSADEYEAVKKFISYYKINMIQWRNLNFDPLEYFKIIKYPANPPETIGVRRIISNLRKSFPGLKMGYYNPAF